MLPTIIQKTCVVAILVATLFMSGCGFVSRDQVNHLNDNATILEVEADRGDAVVLILGGDPNAETREEVMVGDHPRDSKDLAEFVWQRNQVLRNVAETIRKTVGGGEGSEE